MMTVGTDPLAVAGTVVALSRDGRFDEVETLFAPRLRAAVSADTLRSGWAAALAQAGDVVSVAAPVLGAAADGLTPVTVEVTCARGGVSVRLAIDADGMLHGLRLAPPSASSWAPPGYARPGRFTESAVTVGDVPGMLTLPARGGRWPGVVLLGGGGALDMDCTAGPNKPLKDLAWGLATRGVAVVRFDKVTSVHPAPPGLTMTSEYVPYALAASRLLREQPGVDAERVYVAGHSMGGKVAPRVAAADPSVAGLVLLAGDTQPMQHAAVRVARYVASLGGVPDADATIAALARQAALVDSPSLSASTPSAELPFGYSGTYWLDLRGYDPVATAAALDKPMLILQGGRDYQVTVADDLAGWRAGLAGRADVTIRVYDADDHLFFPGTKPASPADLEEPHHVDEAVIADIARWVGARRSLWPRRRR